MKRKIPFILLAAAAACGISFAQPVYTTPVGYTTQTLAAGQFNLLGITVQNPTIAVGTIDVVTGNTLTDNDMNFSELLTSGALYILEITNGSGDGIIQEITSWSGSDLTTPENISTSIEAGVTTYALRQADTLSSIFGANNEAGLLAGNSTSADIVWVPNATGGFDQFYRAVAEPPFVTAGWKRIGSGNTDFSNAPIIYADSFIVQRRGGTSIDLVTAGEVKLGKSATALTGGAFNYVGSVYPAGSTLSNSGLQSTVLQGTSTSADVVWIPQGDGTYLQYYYAVAEPPFVTEGWKRIGGGNTDQSAINLTPGIIIQRKGGAANLILTPPPSYSDL